MSFSINAIILLLAFGSINAEKFSFDGYRLIRVLPEEEKHVEMLSDLEGTPDFDVWNSITRGVNSTVDVALSPRAFYKYSMLFKALKVPFEIVNENLQDLFEEQERSMIRPKNSNIVGKFASHSEINSYIESVVSASSAIASTYDAGTTSEGRNLKVIVLKTASSKRKVWIDCGIHAREWISPSTCVWIIDKLSSGYKSGDSVAQNMLNYFEFHILPVVNPDGYEYSRTSYRMWRKNRSKNAGSTCLGVDLNRNWGYQWKTGGSSERPCDDTYAGPKADSELEVQAIQKVLKQHQGTWDAYITMHTYGNWWFTPMGYTKLTKDVMSNFDALIDGARIGVAALKSVNGIQMTLGSSANILYVASGGSEDWAYAVTGIKYAYCLELRPGQTGTDASYGFSLPQDRAPLAGAETYAGVTAFLKSIMA